MNKTTLNIIRKSINEFELKSVLKVAANSSGCLSLSRKFGYLSLSRQFNETEYYSLYFNKGRDITYSLLSSVKDSTGKYGYYSTSIEEFLLDKVDSLSISSNALGVKDKLSTILYKNITNQKNYSELVTRYKLKIFNVESEYNIDENYLYLFVRLLPTLNTSLLPMIMNIKVANVYSISTGKNNPVNSIGFVCKLNNRQEYNYRKCAFSKDSGVYLGEDVLLYLGEHVVSYKQIALNFKYPFLTKNYINNFLFDDSHIAETFKYKIETNMLYMPTLKLANKHNIKIINNF